MVTIETRFQMAHVVCSSCDSTFLAVLEEGVMLVICDACHHETAVGNIRGFPSGRCSRCNNPVDGHQLNKDNYLAVCRS